MACCSEQVLKAALHATATTGFVFSLMTEHIQRKFKLYARPNLPLDIQVCRKNDNVGVCNSKRPRQVFDSRLVTLSVHAIIVQALTAYPTCWINLSQGLDG